jgi:hypothetical protein
MTVLIMRVLNTNFPLIQIGHIKDLIDHDCP